MIYLDNNATTAMQKQVIQAMMQDMQKEAKNPSAATQWGRKAKIQLLEARKKCAQFLHCRPNEITFTSGATEANNLSIFALAKRYKGIIVTSPIEHPSILEPLKMLGKSGRKIHYLSISETGHINPKEVLTLENIAFVSLGAANSETGVMNPLQEISDILHTLGIPLMIDAVGQFAREPLSLKSLTYHALTLSGHKIHGPKGSGLVIFKNFLPTPLFYGGNQEEGVRAGTENLPAILGLAEAISLAETFVLKRSRHMQTLISYFYEKIKNEVDPCIEYNGTGKKVSNTLNLYFPHHDGQSLLIYLDTNNCIASMGSACRSSSIEPSHVLLAMYPKEPIRAQKSIRFSLCYENTRQQIDSTIHLIKAYTAHLKKISLSTY